MVCCLLFVVCGEKNKPRIIRIKMIFKKSVLICAICGYYNFVSLTEVEELCVGFDFAQPDSS